MRCNSQVRIFSLMDLPLTLSRLRWNSFERFTYFSLPNILYYILKILWFSYLSFFFFFSFFERGFSYLSRQFKFIIILYVIDAPKEFDNLIWSVKFNILFHSFVAMIWFMTVNYVSLRILFLSSCYLFSYLYWNE